MAYALRSGADDRLRGTWRSLLCYYAFPDLRARIVTYVAEQIVRHVRDFGLDNCRFSVLSHSLGTAVAHDAIHRMCSSRVMGSTELQPPSFRFESFIALGNLTRFVAADGDRLYEDTRVRPPNCGLPRQYCAVSRYITVRHAADALASVVPFAPPGWSRDVFESIELRHLHGAAVHSQSHYLVSPQTTDSILLAMFGPAVVTASRRRERLAEFVPYGPPPGFDGEHVVAAVARNLAQQALIAHGDFPSDARSVMQAAVKADRMLLAASPLGE